MLEKLRRKFVIVIMVLVSIALVVMAGVILFMNYQRLSADLLDSVTYATTEDAFAGRGPMHLILDIGADGLPTGGVLIEGGSAAEGSGDVAGSGSGDAGDSGTAGGSETDAGDAASRGDAPPGERRSASDVGTSVYLVSSDGSVSQPLVNALELDNDDAAAALAAVLADHDAAASADTCETGYLGDADLFYGARNTSLGVKVAFASGTYLSDGMWSLAAVLAAVCAGVWAVFLFISVFLARWAVRPAERAWNQQQQFVADASHELKTPLAVMMANNSILLSNAGETVESQRRWVESNQAEAREMLGLVNDMLFLARPENAERQAVKARVDFSEIVERNALQFEAVCFERGIDLSEDVTPGLCVMGDAARLQRLASTLLDNACKYADSQVKVALSATGGQVRLAVSNDGAAIPPEDLPHVFDRFYRVDKARVRSEGGVGLGLAIAQEVAHEHGGSIVAESGGDAGTVFTATLPRAS